MPNDETDSTKSPETTSSEEIDLPNVGPTRWWRVTFDAKRYRAPILVELMERPDDDANRPFLSRAIGWERTVATNSKIIATCETIIERVAQYEEVVGNYGFVKRTAA